MSFLRFVLVAGALSALAGCPQQPASQICPGTGILCPEDMYCGAVQPICLTTACGNGLVDPGEECDDGNVLGGDTCSTICRRESCGNNVLDPNEVCDDGNTAAGDGCSPNCMSKEACGNGIVDVGEVCDDGATDVGSKMNADGCSGESVMIGDKMSPPPCASTEVCGNSIVDIQTGEICDDGNTVSGDNCSADCRSGEGCGNGIVDPGEQCDDGNMNNQDDCLNTCKTARCGDGVVDIATGARFEQCDPSTTGAPLETGTCNIDCTIRACGDGKVNQTAGEQCDNGVGQNGDMRNCTMGCLLNICGDGKVDMQPPGLEQCDDGNTNNTDGCSNACQSASCGNATVDTGEQCDDGNTVDTDACVMCLNAVCGDGKTRAGVEQCDDGNLTNGDGCSALCRSEGCGNGVLDPGEQCDDGNADNTDSCVGICRNAKCGDTFIQMNVELCDDGNTSNGDGCSSTCRSEGCGNGSLDPGEACDDGNMTNGDGCSDMCKFEGCGDGFVNNGEACDGNGLGTAGETPTCNADCTVRSCGDAKVNVTAGEQCDAGTIMGVNQNANNRDCTAACRINVCTDGFKNTMGPLHIEACDDGNQIATDGCNNACQLASCGNGLVDPGEQCDDNNNILTDSCINCMNATCGDGQVEAGVEQCDTLPGPNGEPCSPAIGSTPGCRFQVCGNGIIDTAVGENCDDHNAASNDGCSSDCKIEFCGDGIANWNENCDPTVDPPGPTPPGNTIAGSANCDFDCTPVEHGDGVANVPAGEQCDDGNAVSGDGCSANGLNEFCGNGTVENQEECEGSTDCDPTTCLDVICGNSRVDPGEGCDDGNQTTEKCPYGAEDCNVCASNCQISSGATAYCGDGFKDGPGGSGDTSFSETCDDGALQGTTCDYSTSASPTCMRCNATCTGMETLTAEFCGNGRTFGGTETCDDGNTVTETNASCPYNAASEPDCTICDASCHEQDGVGRYCGDGTIDGGADGEVCDAGGANVATGSCAYGNTICTQCNTSCMVIMTAGTYCGDHLINGGEACDGGNLNGATCGAGKHGVPTCTASCTLDTSACVVDSCGDGIVNGSETCEPKNTAVCDANCQIIPPPVDMCGDGFRTGTEVCDGNDLDGATCPAGTHGTPTCTACAIDNSSCIANSCGDNIVQPPEECEPKNTAVCDSSCMIIPPPMPTCTDSMRNGDETDIDCGGATCSKCADGKACFLPSDCTSGDCTSHTCMPMP